MTTRADELRGEVVDLLGELVAIDSENPGLAPGGAGEDAIATFVEEWATDRGLRAQRLEATTGRPSVVVAAPGRGGGPRLMLCGHLDTVGIGTAGLTPRIDGDRLYGRGAYDMKAGLAAALVAARESARAGLAGDVLVAAVADEEDASLGIEEVLRGHGADAAVVLEPTEMAVATAHRGFVWVEISVEGRAAHGSRPQLGIDAITRMAPVVTALDGLNSTLEKHRHPLLGSGVLHASTITGGREASTVPESCTLVVERRTLPGESAGAVMGEIEEVLAGCRARDADLAVTARLLLDRPSFEVGEDAEIVRVLRQAGRHALGRELETGGVSYFADSALIAAAGIPTALLGPAGEGAHAAVEWVSLSSTLDCVLTLVRAAEQFCGPVDGARQGRR